MPSRAKQAKPDKVLIAALRGALQAASDPSKAGPMQAYVKSKLPCLGVQRGALSKALHPILRSHSITDAPTWRATILTLFKQASYREHWYAGLELLAWRAYKKWLTPEATELCEALIVHGAWWDITDEVATRRLGPMVALYRSEMTPVMRSWASDSNPWKRRSSILVQLKHKQQTDLNLLSHAIEQNLRDKDFFLRKAIGWALREFARTDPDWVISFIEQHNSEISNLSRREALRHLCKEGRALHL